MSTRVPDEFITLLRQKVDIADVVSDYVRLKRVGHSMVGLCPFHSERTPSFNVSVPKGFYHCFGCGAGGTAITFLMEMEQLTFVQAIEKLAVRAGLPVPQVTSTREDDEQAKYRSNLFHVLDLAAKYYNYILLNHDSGLQGLSYFLERQLTKKSMADFYLGFAPRGGRVLVDFLTRRSVAPSAIMDAGLGLVSDAGELRDRFHGRVMFPITDTQGRTVGFGGRTLSDEQPKYLNSPETLLFHKGSVLYGFHKARQGVRQTGQLVLLEGYMDVIALHQVGVGNAVATLGTALTAAQAGVIHRVAEEVILVYDGDQAGRSAAAKNVDVLRDLDTRVRIAQMPDGSDPDQWVRSHDGPQFRSMILDKAQGALPFKLALLTHSHPNHLTSGRIEFLREAVDVVADEPSSIEREATIEWLSNTYGVTVSALREDLQQRIRVKEKQIGTDKGGGRRNTSSQASIKGPLPPMPSNVTINYEVAARQLLTYMLIDADVVKQVQEGFSGEFSSPIHSALQAYLYMYYEHHTTADPELFLSSVDDPQVVQYAAELLHEALDTLDLGPRISGTLVRDYISCLIDHGIEQDLEQVARAMTGAFSQGDLVRFRELEVVHSRLQKALVDKRKTRVPNIGD